jgi:hypothetical protein
MRAVGYSVRRALGAVESLGVVVEVFLGPGEFELPLAGPHEAIPAGRV